MQDTAKFVDLIYEAAFAPDNWEKILNDMARSIDAEGTVLFNIRAADTRWIASAGIMDLINRTIGEGWNSRNARSERLMMIPHQGFLNEADHFTEAEYQRLPIYTELMAPSGYGFGTATAIHVPTGDHLVFSVEKKRAKGPVDSEAIAFLDGIRPHLARSAFLAGRLQFERINAAIEALQLTGLPSAVLGPDGKVLAANTLLTDFGPQITVAAHDRVRFAHNPANLFLAEALESLKRSAGSVAGSRSFPIKKLDRSPGAVVHVIPVRGNARDVFFSAAAFLVVTPVDRSRVPSADTIQGLFDLSPAEARVACLLAEGLDVKGAAKQLSLSLDTVRSHVKAILSKSGLPRQTDFVAAIASIKGI